MDRLNRMLQAAQGMGISAGGGPGGVSQPVALRISPCVLRLEVFCLLSLSYNAVSSFRRLGLTCAHVGFCKPD